MAEFETAFEKTMQNEGGYVLHQVKGDRGGMTYAGISRRYHPEWSGWRILDSGIDSPALTGIVRDFYRENFWARICGDDITDQASAESLFDFAVNAGIKTAVKLAQISAGATPDGIAGPKTIECINALSPGEFVQKYFVAKIARYAVICNRNTGQKKFLLGWINRTLKGVA